MRFPLRCTVLVTAGLLLAPALVLQRLPRPRAEGLGRLLPHAALLQSFPASPGRQAPQLWRQRLPGGTADLLWQQQRQLWWTFWGRDEAGGAYLVMPLPRPVQVGALPPPRHSLQVDGLLVVAANPLAERLLRDQLAGKPRQQRGLQQRCLTLLQQRQGAFWSGDGLAAMAGPLAPLLQSFQEGCIDLALAGSGLRFDGEAGASSGLLSPAAATIPASQLPLPLPADRLLEVSGSALQPLLRGLLTRELIRQPLASSYGLSDADLLLLQNSPFVLRLRPLASGPFQAGLELVLAPRGNRQTWIRMLNGIAERLLERGHQATSGAVVSWRDPSGRVVGGWRWLTQRGEEPLLQLFLGPEPPVFRSSALPNRAAWTGLPMLRLQARPEALSALSLLPNALPLPVQQAQQLSLVAERNPQPADGSVSRLLGSLVLSSQPRAVQARPARPDPSTAPEPPAAPLSPASPSLAPQQRDRQPEAPPAR
jgi:hypothetical protein